MEGRIERKLAEPDFPIHVALLLSAVAIAAAALAGLNGYHVWRQADSYSQILGLLDRGQLDGLQNFFGQPTFYDVPVYQHLVVLLVRITDGDPLVVARVFNLVWWGLFFFCGVSLAERAKPGAGRFMAVLLAGSPLYLHYFSTPIPDVMAVALGVASLLLLDTMRTRARIAGLALLAVVTVIKSPVGFVFAVFALHREAMRVRTRENGPGFLIVSGGILAICALGAEFARKAYLGGEGMVFAQDPHWYFGTLQQRLSGEFLLRMVGRTILTPFAWPMLGLSLAVAFAVCVAVPRWRRQLPGSELASAGLAFLAGWAVFSNVYFLHEYYQLPVTLFVLFGVAQVLNALAGSWLSARASAATVHVVLLAGLSAALVFGESMRDLSRTGPLELAAGLAPRDKPLTFVSDDFAADDPTVGGLLERSYRQVQPSAFLAEPFDLARFSGGVLTREPNVVAALAARGCMQQIAAGRFTLFIPAEGVPMDDRCNPHPSGTSAGPARSR